MTGFPPHYLAPAGFSASSAGRNHNPGNANSGEIGPGLPAPARPIIRTAPHVEPDAIAAAIGALKLVALDCDGVLWVGDDPLPHVPEFISCCKENGIATAAITNNSSRGRRNLAEKAARLGIPLSEEEFYTTNYIAFELARDRYAGGDVLVLGSGDLLQAVADGGAIAHTVMSDIDALRNSDFGKLVYDAVVVGYDRDLGYAGICHAIVAIKNGATFISTNPDFTFPVGGKYLWPGNGAIADLIARVSGVTPEVYGKPHPEILQMAMRDAGALPNETLMIGDRVSTDIACGKNAGAWTCLVETGVEGAGGNNEGSDAEPDIVAADLGVLQDYMSGIMRGGAGSPAGG